jgi:glycine betaine/choline ABC-type transport system substrate-binding protein
MLWQLIHLNLSNTTTSAVTCGKMNFIYLNVTAFQHREISIYTAYMGNRTINVKVLLHLSLDMLREYNVTEQMNKLHNEC